MTLLLFVKKKKKSLPYQLLPIRETPHLSSMYVSLSVHTKKYDGSGILKSRRIFGG